MENTQIPDRLQAALDYKPDYQAIYARERKKNRAHYLKFKDAIQASARRRAVMPKHRIKNRVVCRLVHLMRHPDFAVGKYPYALKRRGGNAITFEELLGCDAVMFREHMAAQFHSGMTWENYGKGWHIGHRVPVRKFDCSDPMQLKACFYYTNLQPELPEHNMRRMNEIVR